MCFRLHVLGRRCLSVRDGAFFFLVFGSIEFIALPEFLPTLVQVNLFIDGTMALNFESSWGGRFAF